MRNKMNLNVMAENDEEEKIENYLNLLHNSQEIKNFLDNMEQEAKKRNVYKYRARIKDIKSAIRTYRINHKKLEEAHDYIGISFITNNENEIYGIVEDLKNILSNYELIDFVPEEMIYSPLVYIKWVPPLGFNIFAHEKLLQNQMEVPIEIRVCSKEAFISEQAAYYSIQKNDTIKMPIEEKNNLRNIVQHITYKLALLTMRDLTKEEIIKNRQELKNIINKNEKFLKKNYELCKDAILDLGRLIYRCVNESEIIEHETKLTKEEIDDIDDSLKQTFDRLLENSQKNIIDKICLAIQKIKLIKYETLNEEFDKYKAV